MPVPVPSISRLLLLSRNPERARRGGQGILAPVARRTGRARRCRDIPAGHFVDINNGHQQFQFDPLSSPLALAME